MKHDTRLELFGAHTLKLDGKAVALKTRRSWALLAILATSAGRSIPRDELATMLWDRSQQDQARASLRQELSNLRTGLKAAKWEPIRADKTSVRFESGSVEIDVAGFEGAVASNDAGKAAALYSGPFLQDLTVPSDPFETWSRAKREALRERAIQVQLASLGVEGSSEAAAPDIAAAARAILFADPANERAHRDLIRHFDATGRRAEALRQFKRCAAALKDDLDVEPSQQTVALATAIRDRKSDGHTTKGAAQGSAAPTYAPVHHREEDAQPRTSTKWRRALISGLAAFGVIIAGTTAVAGVQYMTAGQRLTHNNIVCAVPFLRRGPDPVVTIGAIMPYNVEHGERLRWGMGRFQRDKRNEYPFAFRISIEDSTPGLSALPDIFRSFEREEVKAVLGPLESRKAWEAKKWGNQNEVSIVSPLASASYLARTGGVEYFFRVGMSDGVRAKALTEWLKARKLDANPYIIHELPKEPPDEGDPQIYGQSQATAVKSSLETFEEHSFIRGDEESQLAVAEKIENDGRAVMVFGYTSNIIRILQRMQENGVENPVFLMGVVTERLQNAGLPFPRKLHVVTGIVSEARNLQNSRRLREDFEKEADSRLEYDISAYYAYDAMEMILDAVTAARRESCGGYASPAAVAAALRRTPAKRRKVLHTGFLPDTQEIYFESDGLKMMDGKKFTPVGIGG